MKRVLTALVLIPLVVLAVFRAPLVIFALLVAAIAVLALHEYLNVVKHYGIEPVISMSYAVSILLIASIYLVVRNDLFVQAHASILWLLPLLFGIPVVFRRELRMALAAAAASAFSVLYIAAPLALLILMRRSPFQSVLIVFVLFSVWAGDIAAYYVGKNLGRNKLAPVVSPNKTWEGAVASLLASVAVAMLVFAFERPIASLFSGYSDISPANYSGPHGPMARQAFSFYVIALGIITNIAAQFGDLFESALKRGAQMKDSGSLLPGHGGVLDRIDALFFAIPTVWYYANFHPFWTSYKP